MAKFTFTSTDENDLAFCIQDKYPETVNSVDENGQPITIPNPEDRASYVERRVKEYFTGTAALTPIAVIDNQVKDEKEAAKAAIEAGTVTEKVADPK